MPGKWWKADSLPFLAYQRCQRCAIGAIQAASASPLQVSALPLPSHKCAAACPARLHQVGDLVLVETGDILPVDGVLVEGSDIK